jgi:translation initiation factor 3 subunit F
MSSSSSSAAAAPSAVLLGGCTATSNSSFFLTTTPTYRVHPLVIFSILDHYQRRNDGQVRVVGTLLGQHIDGSNVIEIKQAFPVPHEEEEESATVQIDYHHSMLALYKQVSPKDVVVGWYSTSGSNESAAGQTAGSGSTPEQLAYITSLMHEVYRGQMPASSGIEPLHLNVDVSMKSGMKISGNINSVTRSRDRADLLANFQPVPVEMHAYEEEKIGVDALISGVPDDDTRLDAPATFLTESENIESAVGKILESMEALEAYIERCATGKEKNPNPALALQIHNLLSSLPTLDASTFTSTFSTHIQDLLAIVYLANMTKNQLAIADKANMLL